MQFMFVDKNIRIHGVFRLLTTPIIGCFVIAAICIIFDSVSNIWLRATLKIAVSVVLYAAVQITLKNELVMELKETIIAKICNSNNTRDEKELKRVE